MLDPEQRRLYVDALKAPEGYRFESAVAATYSLDLVALLSVPLHLLMFSNELSIDAVRDPVAVLEALKRSSKQLTVYCQAAQIHAPSTDQLLYPLVESSVIEVAAPRGGAFHPKLWLLRFVSDDDDDPVRLRALILSRNLTFDRSWDVSLRLDGIITPRKHKENAPLAAMVRRLPTLAVRSIPDGAVEQAELFANHVEHAEWELPSDFDELRFGTTGLDTGTWRPPSSDRVAVISPFCETAALGAIAERGGQLTTLVTRNQTLERLGPALADLTEQLLVLKETAEAEDGEDTGDDYSALRGLHAKTYICEVADRVCVAVGSANATNAALLAGSNVELMAELWGNSRKVGTIDSILASDALGKILEPAVLPDAAEPSDPLAVQAETALREARRSLAAADLEVACEQQNDAWSLVLHASGRPALDGIAEVRAWPITLSESGHAVDASEMIAGNAVSLGHTALASITGLIAFELRASAAPMRERFVLNLPLRDAPSDRFAAITRSVVNNREGFLRYLLFLLADIDDSRLANLLLGSKGNDKTAFGGIGVDGAPVLEQLVTALIRDPDRLHAIKRLIDDIGVDSEGREVIPEEFAQLWHTFEPLLEEKTS
jgi:hypothetical protein